MMELRDAYLIDRNKNPDTVGKFFPIELNISGEYCTEGYRYLIFPCLNELLYKSPKIFNTSHLATNLENKF
jgi:hypothetical protein